MFLVTTGDGWPQANENGLRALAREWSSVAEVIDGLEQRLREPVLVGRRGGWGGPAADSFAAAGEVLAAHGNQQLTALVQGSRELSTFIDDTGANVEYVKLIVLGQLVILAGQIAYLASMAGPTFGVSTMGMPSLQAAGRAFSVTAVRQLLVSIGAAEVLQVGLDVTVQALQKFVLHTRREWDDQATSTAAITGAVSAVLAPVMGALGGVASRAASQVGGKTAAEAAEQVGVGAVHEYGTAAGTGLVTGQGCAGTLWDLTAGATGNAPDAAGQLLRRRRGGPAFVVPTGPDIAVSLPRGGGHADTVGAPLTAPSPSVDAGSGRGQATATGAAVSGSQFAMPPTVTPPTTPPTVTFPIDLPTVTPPTDSPRATPMPAAATGPTSANRVDTTLRRRLPRRLTPDTDQSRADVVVFGPPGHEGGPHEGGPHVGAPDEGRHECGPHEGALHEGGVVTGVRSVPSPQAPSRLAQRLRRVAEQRREAGVGDIDEPAVVAVGQPSVPSAVTGGDPIRGIGRSLGGSNGGQLVDVKSPRWDSLGYSGLERPGRSLDRDSPDDSSVRKDSVRDGGSDGVPAPETGVDDADLMAAALLRAAPAEAHPVPEMYAGRIGAYRSYGELRDDLGALAMSEPDVRAVAGELARLAGGGFATDPGQVLDHGEIGVQLARIAADVAERGRGAADRHGLRSALNLLVLSAAWVPVEAGRAHAVPLVSGARLAPVLRAVADDLAAGRDPMVASEGSRSPLAVIRYDPSRPVAERLARLALLNLDRAVASDVARNDVFDRLLGCGLAAEALLAAGGAEQRMFLRTTGVAAVNQLVRAQTPTIAGLVSVGRGFIAELETRLDALAQAGHPVLGRIERRGWPRARRTVDQMARTYLWSAKKKLSAIEAAAQTVVTRFEQDGDRAAARGALGELTRRWSAATQKLSVLSVLHERAPASALNGLAVLRRQLFPQAPGVSRAMAQVGAAAAIPATLGLAWEPKRMARRQVAVAAGEYARALAGVVTAPLVGEPVSLAAQVAHDNTCQGFWRTVHAAPGRSILVESALGRPFLLAAETRAGRPVLVLANPGDGGSTVVALAQASGYLAQQGLTRAYLPSSPLRDAVRRMRSGDPQARLSVGQKADLIERLLHGGTAEDQHAVVTLLEISDDEDVRALFTAGAGGHPLPGGWSTGGARLVLPSIDETAALLPSSMSAERLERNIVDSQAAARLGVFFQERFTAPGLTGPEAVRVVGCGDAVTVHGMPRRPFARQAMTVLISGRYGPAGRDAWLDDLARRLGGITADTVDEGAAAIADQVASQARAGMVRRVTDLPPKPYERAVAWLRQRRDADDTGTVASVMTELGIPDGPVRELAPQELADPAVQELAHWLVLAQRHTAADVRTHLHAVLSTHEEITRADTGAAAVKPDHALDADEYATVTAGRLHAAAVALERALDDVIFSEIVRYLSIVPSVEREAATRWLAGQRHQLGHADLVDEVLTTLWADVARNLDVQTLRRVTIAPEAPHTGPRPPESDGTDARPVNAPEASGDGHITDDGYAERLRQAIEADIDSTYDAYVRGQGRREHADPARLRSWPQIQRMVQRAQRETDALYGRLRGGDPLRADRMPAWVPRSLRRGNVHDGFVMKDSRLDLWIARRRRAMARQRLIALSANGVGEIARVRGQQSRNGGVDTSVEIRVIEDVVRSQTLSTKLWKINRAWSTAQNGHIYIQRFRELSPALERAALWEAQSTFIHEYLHTTAHPAYQAYASSFGPDSCEHMLLAEGIGELLTDIVRARTASRLTDRSLRADVEGDEFRDDGARDDREWLRERPRYPTHAAAVRLAGAVGVENLLAAYFLGEVERIQAFVSSAAEQSLAPLPAPEVSRGDAHLSGNAPLRGQDVAESSGARQVIPPPRAGDELPADTRLQNAYVGENDPDNADRIFYPDTVRYFSLEEREACRLFVDSDGNLRRAADGALFDTGTGTASKAKAGWDSDSDSDSGSDSGSDSDSDWEWEEMEPRKVQRHAIFAMDGHGNLYATVHHAAGHIHHSSILAGEPVAGAGDMEVRNGRLMWMNDRSGHYAPRPEANDRVLRSLRAQGLRTDPDFTLCNWKGEAR